MKFGGTSVGSLEAIERVSKIVLDTEGEHAVCTYRTIQLVLIHACVEGIGKVG